MVAQEFINFFNTIVYANHVAIEDFADRMNLFTVMLFIISCLIISTKQYLLSAITCYIPVKPTGENFNGFLADYCWVHGTIPLRPDEGLPQDADQWAEYDEKRRITYYQWVPFVLGLQCILFYIPHIAWRAVCASRSGGDLFALVKAASDAAISERDGRKKAVNRVKEFLQDMLEDQHADCHQNSKRGRAARAAYNKFGLCIVSKRLGTCLVASYIFVKIYTILNAVIQLYLIQHFLGFYPEGSAGAQSMALGRKSDPNELTPKLPSNSMEYLSGMSFGWEVASRIMSGHDWPETLLFPRVAYCYVPGIRLVGVENSYTAQCTLPINMLNEKFYIFLWFWVVLLICMSSVSLILWLMRSMLPGKRKDLIKRFIRIRQGTLALNRSDVEDFIENYLCQDGLFLVRMLSLNAGEIVTAEVVAKLYEDYTAKQPEKPEKEGALV